MYLDFPNVPNVPGVPALPRFPSSLPQAASFAAAIVGNVMDVSAVSTGLLYANTILSAPGMIDGTRILNQVTGLAGGAGQYLVDTAQDFAGDIAGEFTPPDTEAGTDPATSDKSELSAQSGPQWGLYKNGAPVVIADNVVALDFKGDYDLCDYQLEEGGFQTYNKVYVPFGVRLRFSAGGSAENRKTLIESVDAIAGDLELYDAVTPEKIYSGVNIIHQGLTRTAERGLGLVQMDVWAEQVRVDATATFSTPTDSKPVKNPKNPQSKSAVSSGTVQAVTPSTAQSAAFLNLNDLAKVPRLQ